MTNAELIQKIRNEIERLTDELELQARENAEANNGESTDYCFGVVDMQMNLLSFLDTLESEKPNDQVVEGEVILNGHGLLVDVTKWSDGYKLKVTIKEN